LDFKKSQKEIQFYSGGGIFIIYIIILYK